MTYGLRFRKPRIPPSRHRIRGVFSIYNTPSSSRAISLTHHHQPTTMPALQPSPTDGDRLFANQQESLWHNAFVAAKKKI